MKVAIVGTGLIGGSMAIALREKGLATELIGVEAHPGHAQRALELGLVNKIAPLKEAIAAADLVILAIPVNAVEQLLPEVLDTIRHQVVMDVGSIKERILDTVARHPNRSRFVATHPMWGTEYSGPEAAVTGAFSGKATVICDPQHSDPAAVEVVKDLYQKLGMHIIEMNAVEHDVHVAYISHISHITSFALANTVLEKEREEDAIFELASGGFESTVRLAKSNPAMWVPVLMQNRENILDVLNEHLSQLRKFKACLEKENYEYLQELIENANKIVKIIK
ncbi:MAG TPA: prephenate dehydrogenase [Flavisolibacter sp.]|jgi:prephenate dehydrogenase|nr:prephenate dehydrogenase [Flavisolibacter sp.]